MPARAAPVAHGQQGLGLDGDGIARQLQGALGLGEQVWHRREIAQRLDLLALAIEELPRRQRSILISARLHDRSVRDIAADMGVSRRLVETELKRALEFCADRLQRQIVHRFRPSSLPTAQGVDRDLASNGSGGAEEL